ncbi:MAG: DR2241 family protein [Halobacteriales archaeon]
MSRPHLDALLAAAEDGVDCDGLRVEATGDGYRFETPEGAHDGLSEGELRDVAGAAPAYVSNWHFWTHIAPEKPSRRAFLRWLEADAGGEAAAVPGRYDALAGGHTREWGQLAITVTVDCGDGVRSYDLRHVDERNAERDALDTYNDPFDARELVKYDDRGRYRPLKTAPTLPGGWVFPDLDASDLAQAVDFVYPATVENWYREREGRLDVSHWRETIDRQTGIYGVVKTWDRGEGHDHVNRVAEACCVDSQCLKRREWEYDGETDLDVDGGDGAFPCREPCSLVIAAARQWTKLDGEEPQTYQFELTPSEKEQVEAIIDTVADGRTDEIREADFDDPANHYRARYLRAKRFEDGTLGGVPAHPDDRGAPDGGADEGDAPGEDTDAS